MNMLQDGHLWLHFTRTSDWLGPSPSVPVMERGEGCYVWDSTQKSYLDALSALFCVQAGYGQRDIAQAARTQMNRLPFATNWATAHQPAIDLAAELAERFPPGVDNFFFVNSGSEAVESAIKLAQQYHRFRGEPERVKIVSRRFAYHGTTLGALGVTGLPPLSDPFEPLRPVHLRAPNTNPYRPEVSDPAAALRDVILEAGPDTVSAVIVEPVQNAGGCFVPPPGYLERLRQLCNRYGILLVFDEVITGFGRLGHWTGAERFGVAPDIITFAKGVTSGYAPLGGIAFNSRIADTLQERDDRMFLHGATWGGHPVSCAVASANLRVFEEQSLLANVRANASWLEKQLLGLREDHAIVGDVRGMGYFWALELVPDRDRRTSFDEEQREHLLRGFLSHRMLELGLICRADDRDEPVIQISPPLVAERTVLTHLVELLDQILAEAQTRMEGRIRA